MTFIRLGTTNAWRNLARSLFAILSMAVAAGFLTYSISLSRGYPLLYKADCRAVIGGEIVVYARQFGGTIPEGESRWRHSFLAQSPFSDLSDFHPELLNYGYLSSESPKASFQSPDVQELAESLPDIDFIYPRYQLPAYTLDNNRRSTPLRGRDSDLDALLSRHPRELLRDGRWFSEEDEGEMVAVTSFYQKLPEGSHIAEVGSTIVVEVPRLIYVDDEPIFQNTQPLRFELKVVGNIEVVTRQLDVEGGSVPVYWELPEIQVPLQTWQKIWQEIGGRAYQPEQLTLGYGDLSYLEDSVLSLRQQFPQYTIYGIPEHFQQAERRGLIERLVLNMEELIVTEDTQSALPLDLRLPFTVLIFINAALVVASNLLIMVNERKTEIGILKAVGSQRGQVLLMILSEALLISLVGASVGFIFFRIPATLNQLTNGLRINTILSSILQDAAIVYSVSFVFSLVFGLLPGLRTANLSVMEVLRNE